MKKTKIKDIIFYIIVFGAIVLLSAIALTAAFKSGTSTLKLPFFAGIVYFIGAGIGLFIMYRLNILAKLNKAVFVMLLVLAAIVPRLIWNLYIQTQPFSDFLHLYNYGVNASQGDFKGFVDFYAVFPFKIGFGMILAGLFSIFGSGLWTIKIFNILFSLTLVFIIYAGGTMLYGEKAGRVASLLCALWPAQIMYTSVIASEHVFLVLFTGAVLLTLYFIKKYTYKNHGFWNGNLMVLGAGFITALAQLIRPMAMIMLPVFAVFILLYKRYRADSLTSLALSIKSVVLFVAVYFAVVNLINLPVQKVTGVDITKSDSGFNLMIGTNSKANGMFNNEDFSLIKKNNFNFEKVQKEAKDIAFSRIKNDPVGFAKLALKKFEIQWGNENYGYYWSTISAQNSTAENTIKSHPRIFYAVSQVFYILIILMAVCTCFYTLKEKRYDSLIILMIFGGLLLSYTFLEVQSRYHMPVIPLLIVFGTGFLEAGKRYEI
ncbi:ArnT family glycosyltransferase [Ruminiclostridium cellulolyticum]|uniref:Glycosyltransferase RgtA/B/C/D-like domain-containing protein n=1 Tax=Ruminiclostridium cellulolyticum (strain ATCC 35319 / DSM 5812 / JCM 6584 / H10) TaxID=394503 RepID=B8I8D0_RUMCH|nr:glycosyltransferase family 39 protein [Ruminiclostridium cellulolyticum]ACL77230.1 conserved hypothetical protein [Ruminiclostridium cellulolyticum H10]